VVVGKLALPSSKLFPAKEEGGGKYQPTQSNKATRQWGAREQGNKATNGGGSKGT
jgi:hypothetical protein